MYTVKGSFKDGVATPDEPVEGYEGQPVLITFLTNGKDTEDSENVDDLPTLEEVVARIKASGPDVDSYTPPLKPLPKELLDFAQEDPIAAAEWDRQWAEIEAEMKRRDFEDDQAEGRA